MHALSFKCRHVANFKQNSIGSVNIKLITTRPQKRKARNKTTEKKSYKQATACKASL